MRHLDWLEQRLEEAAREIRQVARRTTPPPIEERKRPGPRAWLVFAAAFAAVVLAVGLLPILSGTGEPKLVGETTSTTIAAMTSTTVTVGTTTTAPVLTAECSASGLPAPAAQEGLPDQVADVRLAMAQAAIACDYDTLEALAGPDLNTSFGGGGFDNIPMWEEQGTYPALELLVRLLDTPFATQEVEDLPRYYVWPSAFVYDTWDEIPAEDIEALLEVFTQEELDQIATFGAYAGWRIGITEDGDWEFFVAGD